MRKELEIALYLALFIYFLLAFIGILGAMAGYCLVIMFFAQYKITRLMVKTKGNNNE